MLLLLILYVFLILRKTIYILPCICPKQLYTHSLLIKLITNANALNQILSIKLSNGKMVGCVIKKWGFANLSTILFVCLKLKLLPKDKNHVVSSSPPQDTSHTHAKSYS